MKSFVASAVALGLFAGVETNAAIMDMGTLDPSSCGGSGYLLPEGSSALSCKTIEQNPFKPSAQSGTVLSNVNLLNGQPAYSIPFATMAAAEGVSFPVSLGFSGPLRRLYDADNEAAPTGWIGYGWYFDVPNVSVNHKGTVSYDDDVFYADLGPFGGGQILTKGGKMFLSSDPTIVITATKNADGIIQSWKFETTGGAQLLFGMNGTDNTAARTMLSKQNFITSSPYNTASAKDFIYKWDLFKISDPLRMNALDFKYSRTNVSYAGKSYTQQSYLSEISRKDPYGNIIERIAFVLADKNPEEYGTGSNFPDLGQRLLETKYLKRIEHYYGGILNKAWTLNSTVKPAALPQFPYPKRMLDEIQIEIGNSRGGTVSDPAKLRWSFTYDAGHHYGLKVINKPFNGHDEYFYDIPNYTVDGWANRSQQKVGAPMVMQKGTNDNDPVVLPNDEATVRDKWENQTKCSEKFCFIGVVDNSTNLKTLYLSVYKNNGNYFSAAKAGDVVFRKSFLSDFENSFQIIPWGDNFIVLNSKNKMFNLFEWDGTTFKDAGWIIQRRRNGKLAPVTWEGPLDGKNQVMKIYPGGDYLVVHDYYYQEPCGSAPKMVNGSKVYVIKKVGGVWKDLNQEECDEPCPLNNLAKGSTAYGDAFKTKTGGCMEFDNQNLVITATPTLFHIVNSGNFVILSYAATATGFNLISPNILYASSLPQKSSAYPMNWEWEIREPFKGGPNYFVIKSTSSGQSRLDVMHFDGVNIRLLRSFGPYGDTGDPQWQPDGTAINVFATPDYFLMSNQVAKTLSACRLNASTDASTPPNPTIGVECQSITGADIPDVSGGDLLLRPGSKAFALEVYPNGSMSGSYPTLSPSLSGTNYRTSIYAVDMGNKTATWCFKVDPVASGFQDPYHRNFYDVSFSNTDNLIVATSCSQGTNNAACDGKQKGGVGHYTALYLPGPAGAGNAFIRKVTPLASNLPATFSTWRTQWAMSAASRLGVECVLDLNTHRVYFSLLQSMATGFQQRPWDAVVNGESRGDYSFVKKFVSYSDINGAEGAGWDWTTEYEFDYLKTQTGALVPPEFNSHTLGFVFPVSTVKTIGTAKTGSISNPPVNPEGMVTLLHTIDKEESPVLESESNRIGLLEQRIVNDVTRQLGSNVPDRRISDETFEYHPPASDPSWPDKLTLVRLKKSTSTQYARNASRTSSWVSYPQYNPLNNQPVFTKMKKGGDWILKQSLWTASNLASPYLQVTYRLPGSSEPQDATLAGWPAGVPYDKDGALSYVISASQVAYDAKWPLKKAEEKSWVAEDQSITDEQLTTGKDPVYSFSLQSGWETRSRTTAFNALGQVMEARAVHSDILERPSAAFYEGRASWLVGTVDNALLSDASILTGENGSVSQMTAFLDWEGRWKKNGAVYSYSQALNGQYSLSLSGSAAPSVDLSLYDVKTVPYDYLISAWIYCDGGTKPSITVERWKKGAASPSSTLPIVQDPAGEQWKTKKWQRYEMKITNAQIRGSEPLFATANSGDYLRVKLMAGSGANAFVDDIVCMPSTANYSLKSYNAKGQVIGNTDNAHLTSRIEYSAFGQPTATRDDLNRIFTSGAAHQPGEND